MRNIIRWRGGEWQRCGDSASRRGFAPREGAVLDEDDVGAALAKRIAASFAARYNGYRTQSRGFFILVPQVAFAWSRFPHDATCWSFSAP